MTGRLARLAVLLLFSLAGSCTLNLWASTCQTKTFFGEAELTAWVDDGKSDPRVEYVLREVDPEILRVLPGAHHALELALQADMRDWLRQRLEPSRGKRSRIETTVRSMRFGEVTDKDGSKRQAGWLELTGTVPPLAEVLLPEDLDYGRPGRMDPALLEWIGEIDLRCYKKWVRYAPVSPEGEALSWEEAARRVSAPGPRPGLIVSVWNGRSWIHSRIPTELIGVKPRPALQLEGDGSINWKWSVRGKLVEGEPGKEVAAAGRVPLPPGPPVHVRYRGRVGVGFLGVLWRIPATPVTLVGDILLLPAFGIMAISSSLGYDV